MRSFPKLLMVSGGSDSTALLEICAKDTHVKVLHINHLLRGEDSNADEAFVRRRCQELGVPCEVRRVDVAALARATKSGMEAAAREARYSIAEEVLDAWCATCGFDPSEGRILTAHTLDDRVETFYMRSLVGTGPGGLSSIPRGRGRVRRPLLDRTREQLRDLIRTNHPGCADSELWREDKTNTDGSNFRSRIRMELIPVLQNLRPGFEASLARTMDLIEEEDASLSCQAESLVLRNLQWDGNEAVLPVSVLQDNPRYMARRILRMSLLVVNPIARLESTQIERVLDGCAISGFKTEVSSGVRVVSDGMNVRMNLPIGASGCQ